MDEVIISRRFSDKLFEKIRGIFIIEPVSFSKKKRVNLRGIAWLGGVFLVAFCIIVFLAPAADDETQSYNETKSPDANIDAIPNQAIFRENSTVTSGIRSYSDQFGGGPAKGSDDNRNTTMIIARENDASTTVPAGTKFSVKLEQNVTVMPQPIPVIGRIVSAVSGRSSVAIPEGAQIFGEATLDDNTERASIIWKSILFPDGRSKALSAIALGADNQAGVDGDYHSDAVKNTAGQMISRFVAGFAEGSISRGAMGATQGGVQNGLRQGVADTAKDRSEAWSDDLKKPRAWIELEAGTQFQSIISQPFIFRDPGGLN
jgi:hypothetical protein